MKVDLMHSILKSFEHSERAMTVFNTEYEVIGRNNASLRYFREIYDTALDLGTHLVNLTNHRNPELVKAYFKQTLNGKYQSNVRKFHCLDGSIRWIVSECLPFYGPHSIIGGILLSHDITEKVAQKDLLEAYERLLHNAPAHLCLFNKHEHLSCNQPNCKRGKIEGSNESHCTFSTLANNLLPLDLNEALQKVDESGYFEHNITAIQSFPNMQTGKIKLIKYEGQVHEAIYAGIIEDSTLITQYESNIQLSKSKDYLTSTGNHSFMIECLHDNIHNNEPFNLFHINIDAFRSINTIKGFDFGDQLLIDFSQKLKLLFPDDAIIRSQGDQFYIVNPVNKSLDISKLLYEALEFKTIKYTVSIGRCAFPEHTKKINELLYFSEMAKNNAKLEYGNSLVDFNIGEVVESSLAEYIDLAFKDDLFNNKLYLVFQPIYNAIDQNIEGYEALIRWHDDRYGQLSPEHFIPILEKKGHINLLTRWVINECNNLLELNAEHFNHRYLSINISLLDLMSENFMRYLETLDTYKPEIIKKYEFEITESYYMDNFELLRGRIERIRKMGIGIAIDDFGTGYSTLEKLVEIPFDRIKIDKTFVKRLPHSKKELVILKAIQTLATELNLMITVEGVESPSQYAILSDLDINTMQGYYFSKPINFDDCLSLHIAPNKSSPELCNFLK